MNNRNMSLEGVVASAADKNIAEVTAKGVSGLFSVKNNLLVEK